MFVAIFMGVTGPARGSVPEVIYDSGGFEAFTEGALNGQFGWVGSGVPAELEPQVVEPTAGDQAVILFSSDASDTGSAMFFGFSGDLAEQYTTINVAFDIFRPSEGEVDPQTMLWLWVDGPDPFLGVQDPDFTYPLVGSSAYLQASTVFDRYATLELEWDLVNGTASGWYDGSLLGSLAILSTGSMSVFGIGLTNSTAGQVSATGLDFGLVDNFVVTGVPVPEPATLLLAAFGLAGGLAVRRRWKQRV